MRNRAWMISGLIAVAVLAGACGSKTGGSPASTPTATTAQGGGGSQAATLKMASTSLGAVVTDAQGFTLYWFAQDTSSSSACTGACASTWPPVSGQPQAASGVTLTGALGTITRPDGSTQATYAGHPLYRYVLDTGPGQTHGDGVEGLWHAALVSGGAAASPTPSQTASSGGGGGGGYGY